MPPYLATLHNRVPDALYALFSSSSASSLSSGFGAQNIAPTKTVLGAASSANLFQTEAFHSSHPTSISIPGSFERRVAAVTDMISHFVRRNSVVERSGTEIPSRVTERGTPWDASYPWSAPMMKQTSASATFLLTQESQRGWEASVSTPSCFALVTAVVLSVIVIAGFSLLAKFSSTRTSRARATVRTLQTTCIASGEGARWLLAILCLLVAAAAASKFDEKWRQGIVISGLSFALVYVIALRVRELCTRIAAITPEILHIECEDYLLAAFLASSENNQEIQANKNANLALQLADVSIQLRREVQATHVQDKENNNISNQLKYASTQLADVIQAKNILNDENAALSNQIVTASSQLSAATKAKSAHEKEASDLAIQLADRRGQLSDAIEAKCVRDRENARLSSELSCLIESTRSKENTELSRHILTTNNALERQKSAAEQVHLTMIARREVLELSYGQHIQRLKQEADDFRSQLEAAVQLESALRIAQDQALARARVEYEETELEGEVEDAVRRTVIERIKVRDSAMHQLGLSYEKKMSAIRDVTMISNAKVLILSATNEEKEATMTSLSKQVRKEMMQTRLYKF